MSEQRPYNPDDLEFLISRALDGDLSDEESRRLSRALEASEALRVEEGQYRSLHDLVTRWASRAAPDAEEFTAAVLGRTTLQPVESSRGDAADGLDTLLSGYGGREPKVDWDRFSSEVAARIATGRPAALNVGRVMRWTGGLAAAAAIGMVFMLSVPRESPSSSEHMVVWVHQSAEVSDFEFETSVAPQTEPGSRRATTPNAEPKPATLSSSHAGQTVIWERTIETTTEPMRSARSPSGWAIIGAGGAPPRSIGGLP